MPEINSVERGMHRNKRRNYFDFHQHHSIFTSIVPCLCLTMALRWSLNHLYRHCSFHFSAVYTQ